MNESISYFTPTEAAAALLGMMARQAFSNTLFSSNGMGVADRLMDCALATALAARAPEIYLTVFDHNARAKRFYARYGFEEVVHCTFQLGDRVDDDRVWRKLL